MVTSLLTAQAKRWRTALDQRLQKHGLPGAVYEVRAYNARFPLTWLTTANPTLIPGPNGVGYDVANRMISAIGESYSYAPSSERVWKKRSVSAGGKDFFWFYGARGERLGTYALAQPSNQPSPVFTFPTGDNEYRVEAWFAPYHFWYMLDCGTR